MVLGDTMSVMLELQVDISQIAKLKVAREQIDKFQRQAGRGMGQMNGEVSRSVSQLRNMGVVSQLAAGELAGVASASISTGKSASSGLGAAGRAATFARAKMGGFKQTVQALKGNIAKLTGGIQQMRMAMLNMMFTGLNLAFLFGAILALSPRVRAGFMAIVASLRLVAIQAGQMLLPHMLNLAKAIRNLDTQNKKLIAKIAIVGTLFGVLLGIAGILGQAILSIAGGAMKLWKAFTLLRNAAIVSRLFSLMVGVIGQLKVAVLSLSGFITGTLIPALGATAFSIAGIAVPIGVVVAAVVGLIAAFFHFQSVRKGVAKGIGVLHGTLLSFKDLLIFIGESAFNTLMISLLQSAKFIEKTKNAFTEFGNTIIEKAIGAINQLIRAINTLAKNDPTGLIPTFDEVNADAFTKDIDTSKIDALNGKITEFKLRQQDANEKFRNNMAENIRKSKNLEDQMKNTLQANEKLTVGEALSGGVGKVQSLLGMKGGAAGAGGNMPSMSGSNVSQRGIVGPESMRGGGFKKEEKTINNEINFENPTIKEEADADQLVERMNEELERSQKRRNTTQ